MSIEHLKISHLLRNQFSLGSLKKRCNKLLWSFLIGFRNNYVIIDLNHTILNLYKTISLLKYLFLHRRKLFIVDWDLSILSDMIDICTNIDQLYLCGKWICGFLTNLRNFRLLFEKFYYFLIELKANIYEKKNELMLKKRATQLNYFNYIHLLETFSHFYFKKLSFSFNSNLFKTTVCPSFFLILGFKKNYGAFNEALKLNLLFTSIIDSDEAPASTFPLYGNADSSSVKIYFMKLIRALKFFNILNEFIYFFKFKKINKNFNNFLEKNIITILKRYQLYDTPRMFFNDYFFEEFKYKKNNLLGYLRQKSLNKIKFKFYTNRKNPFIRIRPIASNYRIKKVRNLLHIPYAILFLKKILSKKYKNILNIHQSSTNFFKIYKSWLYSKQLIRINMKYDKKNTSHRYKKKRKFFNKNKKRKSLFNFFQKKTIHNRFKFKFQKKKIHKHNKRKEQSISDNTKKTIHMHTIKQKKKKKIIKIFNRRIMNIIKQKLKKKHLIYFNNFFYKKINLKKNNKIILRIGKLINTI